MNQVHWRDRAAHARECLERTVHPDAPDSAVRICCHGVAFGIWPVRFGADREWRPIDPFFIKSGIYEW